MLAGKHQDSFLTLAETEKIENKKRKRSRKDGSQSARRQDKSKERDFNETPGGPDRQSELIKMHKDKTKDKQTKDGKEKSEGKSKV